MDWGFDNPNKTAALITTLIIAVWFLAYMHKWGFWVALALFTGLSVCLVHTFSRGGFLGAVIGLVTVVWRLPHPWPCKRVMGIVASVLLTLSLFFAMQAHKRFSQGIVSEDHSITNRWEIWKTAPRMMVDAPHGWGWGRAGQAYMQWYQPVNRSEAYRTLVNSHLTWLVELSWPLRFLYTLAWLVIFLLCWPAKGESAIPLGIWMAFAVTAFFSSVAESLWLWIVPAISLLTVLSDRMARMSWLRWVQGAFAVGAAAAITFGLFLIGQGDTDVQKVEGGIIWGKGTPQIWVLIDQKTLEGQCGRTWRVFLASSSLKEKNTVGFIDSVGEIKEWFGKTVVISGAITHPRALASIVADANKVVFLNPDFPPQEVGLSRERAKKMMAVFGEFSQSPLADVWRDFAIVRRIKGAGDFLFFEGWSFVLDDRFL